MESSNALDLTLLLSAMLHRAARWIKTSHGYICLLNPLTQKMEIVYGMGLAESYVESEVGIGEGLAGMVWESNEAINIPDYRTWIHRVSDGRLNPQVVAIAALGVPIREGDEVVGVIGLFSLDHGREFTPEEVEFLNRLGQIAGSILDNATKSDAEPMESHIQAFNSAISGPV